MARRFGLYVGLNEVDGTHYRDQFGEPWRGTLHGCENDAMAMATLMVDLDVTPFAPPLLTAEATSTELIAQLAAIADVARSGDLVVVTFAGHGGQIPDDNEPDEEHMDETWCLFDREVIDDELQLSYGKFVEGVRLVVISDSCHSGTVTRLVATDEDVAVRTMTESASIRTELANHALYRSIRDGLPSKSAARARGATVELLAACRDDEESRDGDPHGAFTAALVEAWGPPAVDAFAGWLEAAGTLIPSNYEQHPVYSTYTIGIEPRFA